MTLEQAFKEFIEREKLFRPEDGLLLAVSGGLDSMVLAELCHRAGFHFMIAHANFQLRGEESDADEALVWLRAEHFGVDLAVTQFETKAYAEKKKISIQMAARELRYEWFHALLKNEYNIPAGDGVGKFRPAYILTAHHQDDNIETALLNYFKGTGIRGLRGILPRQGKLVRPLLFANKFALATYAEQQELPWREDSSNLEDKYSRNYFRHQLIPLARSIYPETEANLADNLDRFREVEALYLQAIALHKKKLLVVKGNEVHIPVLKLRQSSPLPTIIFEIIRDYGFETAQVEEVLKLMDSATGKWMQSASHRILKNRNWLIISPIASEGVAQLVIDESAGSIVFDGGSLRLEKREVDSREISTDALSAYFDASAIQFPLLLRRWRAGDYFYPLGMKKKKKLSRFFIDQKMSQLEKEKTWVLEMDRKIIWVVGRRIDDRVKLNKQNDAAWVFRYNPA